MEGKSYWYEYSTKTKMNTGEVTWDLPQPELLYRKPELPTRPRLLPSGLARVKAREMRSTFGIAHIFSGLSSRTDGIASIAEAAGMRVFDFDIQNGAEQDVLDPKVQANILGKIRAKFIRAAIIGTPCDTFSVLHFRKGGPGPLRTREHILGRPDLASGQRAQVAQSERFIQFTYDVCIALYEAGGAFIIENPADHSDWEPRHGPLWLHPKIIELQERTGARVETFDQCGLDEDHEYRKRTSLMNHNVDLRTLNRCRCPGKQGGHEHKKIHGTDANGHFHSAHSAAYPTRMNEALVSAIKKFAAGVAKPSSRAPMLAARMPAACAPVASRQSPSISAAARMPAAVPTPFAAPPMAAPPMAAPPVIAPALAAAPIPAGAPLVARPRVSTSGGGSTSVGRSTSSGASTSANVGSSAGGLSLDAQQRAAVTVPPHTALAIVAAAGSGKTHVVHQRIVHLVSTHGLVPMRILCLTFAKDASRELLRRLKRSALTEGVRVSTFHSFALSVLRSSGIIADGAVLDEKDPARRQLMAAAMMMQQRANQCPPAAMGALDEKVIDKHLNTYTACKQKGVASSSETEKLYAFYEQRKRESGRVDLCDLMPRALAALRADPALLAACRPDHLVIDEFQDCTTQQHDLLVLLLLGVSVAASGGQEAMRGVTVVGDTDQGIYAFTGAKAVAFGALRDALADAAARAPASVPSWRLLTLNTNYRSTGAIVTAATAVVEPSTQRTAEQRVVSAREAAAGAPIEVIKCRTSESELDFVMSRLLTLQSEGVPLHECAVLTRTNKLKAEAENACRRARLPIAAAASSAILQPSLDKYVAVLRLLTSTGVEADDALLHVAEDSLPLPLVIEMRRHVEGVRKVEAAKAADDHARRASMSQRSVSSVLGEMLSPMQSAVVGSSASSVFVVAESDRKRLRTLLNGVYDLQMTFEWNKATIGELMNKLHKPGPFHVIHHHNGEPPRALKRLTEELETLLRGKSSAADRCAALRDLLSDSDRENELLFDDAADGAGAAEGMRAIDGGVHLSSIHKAKGREWSRVFIIGLNEDADTCSGALWRMTKADEEPEERRVLHVAMTRAKDELVLSYAMSRERMAIERLRFLDDLQRLPCVHQRSESDAAIKLAEMSKPSPGAAPARAPPPALQKARPPAPLMALTAAEESEEEECASGLRPHPISRTSKATELEAQIAMLTAELHRERAAATEATRTGQATKPEKAATKARREAGGEEGPQKKKLKAKGQTALKPAPPQRPPQQLKAAPPPPKRMARGFDDEHDSCDESGGDSGDSGSDDDEEDYGASIAKNASRWDDAIIAMRRPPKPASPVQQPQELCPTSDAVSFKGRRISLWWAGDRAWYDGSVSEVETRRRKGSSERWFHVNYADGDRKWHHLEHPREVWKLLPMPKRKLVRMT